MEERDDQLREEELPQEIPVRKRITTSIQYHTMSMAEKVKYAACAGGISAGVLELFGAGGPGLGIAALIAFGSGYWSEELQRGLVKKLPRPRESDSSRQGKLKWWLTGDEDPTQQEGATVEQVDMVVTPDPAPQEARKRIVPPGQGPFPIYPPDETLRLGRVMTTKQRFDPSINALLGAGIIVAGSQGAGKSNLAGVIFEHTGNCRMPEIIFDLKREFW